MIIPRQNYAYIPRALSVGSDSDPGAGYTFAQNGIKLQTQSSGQFLRCNGTAFVSASISSGDLPSHTHTISDVTGLSSSLAGKSDVGHTHNQSDIVGLVSDLAGKASTTHTHAASDITSGTIATARLGSGTASASTYLRGDQTWATISGGTVTSVALSLPGIFSVSGSPVTGSGTLSASFNSQTANTVFAGPSSGSAAAPAFRSLVSADLPSHSHSTGDITGLGTAAVLNVPSVGNAASGEVVKGSDTRLSDSRTPTSHTHPQSDITNLVSDLAGKAASSHTHAQSDVTNLVSDLAGKASTTHTHAAGDITSGTISTARLGSGTASSSTFLRGDNTWATPGGGGTVTSVGLSLPAMFSVSGSPVTGSGTLTATLASQSANTVLAGPTTGAAAAPTFRALVAADLPAHTHANTDISGLGTASTLNVPASGNAASGEVVKGSDTRLSDARTPTAHSHAQSDITNLVSDLAGKAASSHTHAAGDITSGVLATGRLGTGTADSTKYLRGDGTWATVSASASLTSGETFITGDGDYSLTGSFAVVDLGTYNAEITVGSAGTYIVTAEFSVRASTSLNTAFRFYRSGVGAVTNSERQLKVDASRVTAFQMSAIITTTGSETLQLQGKYYDSGTAPEVINSDSSHSSPVYLRYLKIA